MMIAFEKTFFAELLFTTDFHRLTQIFCDF